MKTVIVTGGAGYIGSILVRKLLNNGFKVVCIDRLNFGGESLLDVWDHPLFQLECVDITTHKEVAGVLKKHKNAYALVHLAAIVGDPACKLAPELAKKTNLESSINLVERAKEYNIERFIFASTCSNYGKMSDAGEYVDETSPLAPVSLYAETKVAVEKYILEGSGVRDGNFCPTCLRFATVYGLSPRMRFDLTVNEFTKELTLGKKLLIFGEQFWRPYCYVGDFSRAILNVLGQVKEKVAFNVFNVGNSHENYTKKMIAEELLNLIPEAKIEYVKKNEDPRDYRVNFEKIKNELGFNITKTVPEGMKDIFTCLKSQIINDPEDQRFYNIPLDK
jgi:nucleoside-diphosphate-sugar epimerase